MSSRFPRPDARNDLFSTYNRSASPSKSKQKPHSPYSGGGYAYSADAGFSAYPSGASSYAGSNRYAASTSAAGEFRSATPNSRGQYSSAVLDELESQNENEHVGILTGKVRQLKDLTHLIGEEIRDSTTLAEKMNDRFEDSRLRLRGTMNRMLSMARKTGVGWKAWLAFFAAVILLFWWVWLG